jgi:hypothetical protein
MVADLFSEHPPPERSQYGVTPRATAARADPVTSHEAADRVNAAGTARMGDAGRAAGVQGGRDAAVDVEPGEAARRGGRRPGRGRADGTLTAGVPFGRRLDQDALRPDG